MKVLTVVIFGIVAATTPVFAQFRIEARASSNSLTEVTWSILIDESGESKVTIWSMSKDSFDPKELTLRFGYQRMR